MKNRRITLVIAALTVSALLAGCGGSSSSDSGSYKAAAAPATEEMASYDYEDDLYDYDYAAEESAPAEANSTSATEGSAPSDSEIMSNSNRKLIKTVNMSAETREFDKFVANITDKINTLGGYAQSMDISGNSYDSHSERNAYIVARIPASKLDFFVTDVAENSNITSKNESAEDVTLQYADVEAHKESLKIEQQRLNELLEQADTLENIIELENRLTEVRYEIESYESRLRTMNNQVVYATVNLNVREVKEYTPEPIEEKTFGQRLSEEFLESCADAWETIQDFIIGFVAFLPTLLVLLIILFVVFIIVFGVVKLIIAIVKKANKNKTPKAPKVKPAPKTAQQQNVQNAPNAPAADQGNGENK